MTELLKYWEPYCINIHVHYFSIDLIVFNSVCQRLNMFSCYCIFQKCELCPQKDGALKRTDTGGMNNLHLHLYYQSLRRQWALCHSPIQRENCTLKGLLILWASVHIVERLKWSDFEICVLTSFWINDSMVFVQTQHGKELMGDRLNFIIDHRLESLNAFDAILSIIISSHIFTEKSTFSALEGNPGAYCFYPVSVFVHV